MQDNPLNVVRWMQSVELLEGNKYALTCLVGHEQIVLLQQQKFEMLFEVGATAILDGYYREAVTSFASSLERTYEFFSVACMIEHGLPWEVIEAYRKGRDMKLSERQLGAFIALFTLETGTPPKLLHPDLVAFRNKVVHDGRVPTRKEALSYGQAVLEIIRNLITEMKTRFPKGIDEATTRHLTSSYKDWGNATPSTMTIATIVSLNIADEAYNRRSLEEALNGIEEMRSKMSSAL
jgi:hypothetical protein